MSESEPEEMKYSVRRCNGIEYSGTLLKSRLISLSGHLWTNCGSVSPVANSCPMRSLYNVLHMRRMHLDIYSITAEPIFFFFLKKDEYEIIRYTSFLCYKIPYTMYLILSSLETCAKKQHCDHMILRIFVNSKSKPW